MAGRDIESSDVPMGPASLALSDILGTRVGETHSREREARLAPPRTGLYAQRPNEFSVALAEQLALRAMPKGRDQEALRDCFIVLRALAGDATNREIAALHHVHLRTVQRAKERFVAAAPDVDGQRAADLERHVCRMYDELVPSLTGWDLEHDPPAGFDTMVRARFDAGVRTRRSGRPARVRRDPVVDTAALKDGPGGGIVGRMHRLQRYHQFDEQAVAQLTNAFRRFGPREQFPRPEKGLPRDLRITLLREIAKFGYADLAKMTGLHPDSCRRIVRRTLQAHPELRQALRRLHHKQLASDTELRFIDAALKRTALSQRAALLASNLEIINRERDRLILLGALPSDRRSRYAARVSHLDAELAEVGECFGIPPEAQERIALIADAWVHHEKLPAAIPGRRRNP